MRVSKRLIKNKRKEKGKADREKYLAGPIELI